MRVDESEALGPYHRELRTNALTLSGFLLLLAGAGFGLWRERRFAYEKAIARGKARLSLVLEHANDAIFFISLDGRILEANRRASEFHGYTHEELLQLDDDALYPPETAPEVREWMGNARLGDGIVGEHLHRRKDGSTFPVEVSVRMVEIGSRRFYLAIVRDITERKRMEEQFLLAHRMETVGALAGGMAHDFNNLMQAILTHTRLLGAHPDDAQRVGAVAGQIEEQVARGALLTRQLLLFARREVVKPERLDINEIVQTTVGLLRHRIRENVTVQLDLASDPLPVEADRGQLEQVIVNLAVNAFEAMPAGGVLSFATAVAEDGGVWLTVRDTGPGIPEEIRAHLFEPFFSTKHASEGAGLGLAVVHGIVSKHGGRIEVESVVGKGATFRITLPRKVSGELAVIPETVVAPQGSGEGHGERVLLVEDDAAVREGLTEMLTMLGYEVVAVESGEEAQALPAQPPFHLLLTDLLLPGVSGADLARALAARWGDLKVIVMSGYAAGDEAVRGGVAAGTVRFLQKPFDMDTLARVVRGALSDEALEGWCGPGGEAGIP